MQFRFILRCAALASALAGHWPASAQNPLDQVNPVINERTLPREPDARPDRAIETGRDNEPDLAAGGGSVRPQAIIVEGAQSIPISKFSQVISDYSGKNLTKADLAALAGNVARIARENGYPLASASVGAQTLVNGVLRVTLDEGRIDAVRVIGATNPAADRILTRHLANGKSVRAKELERAILLVDDLPGVTVRRSQFTRSEGFGILLVTIETDKASAYVQFDNRGNKEVGPIRSTLIANLRDLATSGDELTFVAAQTPLQPREFNFVRLRYALPVDRSGSTVELSGSYGRAKPGGSLSYLNVLSESHDF